MQEFIKSGIKFLCGTSDYYIADKADTVINKHEIADYLAGFFQQKELVYSAIRIFCEKRIYIVFVYDIDGKRLKNRTIHTEKHFVDHLFSVYNAKD